MRRRASGQVTVIENTVDVATGTVPVRATMPNMDELLCPGTLVTVQLTFREEEAVTVPSTAPQVSQSVIESGFEGGELVEENHRRVAGVRARDKGRVLT